MRLKFTLVMAALMLAWAMVWGVAPVQAQSPNQAAGLVRDWYQRYLERDAGAELTAWVELLRRGSAEIDVEAAILGSDEYFQRCRQNPQRFVSTLYADVASRNPSPQELRRGVDRLTTLGNDRTEYAREFIIASRPPAGPGLPGAPNIDPLDTARRLAAAGPLFVDSVHIELAGTSQGRQLEIRGNAMTDVAEELVEILRKDSSNLARVQGALQNIDRAYDALQESLGRPAGTAPAAAAIARQMRGWIVSLQRQLSGPPGPPPGPPGPGGGSDYDVETLSGLVASISRNTQSVIALVARNGGQRDRSFLVRNLESFSSDLDSFESQIERGAPRVRVINQYRLLSEQASSLGNQLAPYPAARTLWVSVGQGVRRIGEALNINGGFVPPITSIDGNLVVAQADRAVAELDAFSSALNPLLLSIPQVPRVHSQARGLRNSLSDVRQLAIRGGDAGDLTRAVEKCGGQFEELNRTWERSLGQIRIFNPPSLRRVGVSIAALQQLVSAGPGGRPQTLVPDLTGYWQFGNRPVEVQPLIIQTNLNLQITNELGEQATGRWIDERTIEARWLGGVMTARVDRDEIVWANRTVWRRLPLTGCWFENGRPVQAVFRNNCIAFIGLDGRVFRGAALEPGLWGVPDLKLTGRWSDRGIAWSSGVNWTDPTWLAGIWDFNGLPCRIAQDGASLNFVNEKGETSRGLILDPRTVQATDWKGLAGTLDRDQLRIRWANGDVWARVR